MVESASGLNGVSVRRLVVSVTQLEGDVAITLQSSIEVNLALLT